ncbi:MAG: winged helix-turn-helix transcriptional regulator, partial [Gammaproteobacteria bacterium]|nr:winged helix-turn-helix transcriptional regulator [Gammaproteobacteria bacterium]
MIKRSHQNMWKQLIKLSKDSEVGLQTQLRKSVANLILERSISPDMPLPSSRELAWILEISRSTVTLVYQRLVDEGFLVSRERQGYFVNPELVGANPANEPGGPEITPRGDWSNRLKHRITSQRN